MKTAGSMGDLSSIPPLENPRLLIRASAGTGKTFQLSSRYIALLRKTSPDRILSSTFTRKAAGEILERILLRLARAVVSAGSLKELGRSINDSSLSRPECLRMLEEFTRQLHRVRICTLDAFFSQLAGSHALELGFPSGWRILDPVEVEQLRGSALGEMLYEGDQQELVQLMHLLDKGDSSRSVSGLMSQTINDLYHVFVESSPEAWNRFPEHQFLSEAHREKLLEQLQQIQVDQKRMQTALTKDIAVFRQGLWDDFLKKGLLPKIQSGTATYYNAPIPAHVCDLYLQLGEHCLAVAATSWQQQTQAAWRLLDDFWNVLDRLKQSAGGLEFGDVTRRLAAGQLSQALHDTTFRMDGTIEHLLLDEFQDTSRPQWDVIRRFAETACQDPQRSFFCVGDVKQAIYGWRGGEAAIFDAIESQLPNLESQPLNLSYRSSPVVIAAVNEAMTHLDQHDNLEDHADLIHEWCKKFPLHETTRSDLKGYVCLRTGPEVLDEDNIPTTSREQREAFWKFSADYVATLARRSPQATIGILTRGNAAVGRMIFELSRLGIEASEEGGNPLTDAAGVQLILSLLKLADHPGDTIAEFHVARSPLGTALGFDGKNAHETASFAQSLRARLIQQGYGGVIHNLALQLAPACHRREYRRLLQLALLGDRYDATFSSLRPSEFVRYVKSQRCEEPTNSNVRVMTIHQSKGLEFDIVVLPDLNNPLMLPPRYVTRHSEPGGPPELVALYRSEDYFHSLGGELLSARQQTRDRMMQEALCLLYVAMTRAAHSLHMLIPPQVRTHHPKSFAGLLRAALAPQKSVAPNQVLWEIGNPDWDAERPLPPVPVAPPRPIPLLHFAPSRTPHRKPAAAPSRKKQGSRIVLANEMRESGFTAADRGTLFHLWLQQILWLDEQDLHQAEFRSLAHQSGLSESDVRKHLQDFLEALKQPEIRNCLSRRSFQERHRTWFATGESSGSKLTLEVRTEFPFLEETSAGGLVNGTIDRLVLILDRERVVAAEILDFKTDQASSPKDVARLKKLYSAQIDAYRAAVCRLWNLEPDRVRGNLVFLTPGVVAEQKVF